MRPEKPVHWEGSSRRDVRTFPEDIRQDIGHSLQLVQWGEEPPDGGPLTSVGSGVYEIRVDDGDAYRVVYVAKFEEAVYVLHAFQKKSKKGIATPRAQLNLAKSRYNALIARRLDEARKQKKQRQQQGK